MQSLNILDLRYEKKTATKNSDATRNNGFAKNNRKIADSSQFVKVAREFAQKSPKSEANLQTKRISYKGSFSLNDKFSADRNQHTNKFAKFTVPIYNISILTRFKPS